jgi:hypothetical protein
VPHTGPRRHAEVPPEGPILLPPIIYYGHELDHSATDPAPIPRRERVWLHMATTRMRGGMVELGLEFLEGVEMEPPYWWLRAMALHLAEGRRGSDAAGFGFGERVLALATAGNDLATLRTMGAVARKGNWWTLAVRAFALAGDRDPVRRMIVEAVFNDADYGVRLLRAIGVEIDEAVARDLRKARRTSMQQIRDAVRPLLACMQPAPMSPPAEDPDPEIDHDSLYDTYGAAPRPLSLKKVATMRALPAREEEGEDGIWSETPQLLAEKRFACGAHDLAIETLVEARDVEELVRMGTQIYSRDSLPRLVDMHRCFDAAEAVREYLQSQQE